MTRPVPCQTEETEEEKRETERETEDLCRRGPDSPDGQEVWVQDYSEHDSSSAGAKVCSKCGIAILLDLED